MNVITKELGRGLGGGLGFRDSLGLGVGKGQVRRRARSSRGVKLRWFKVTQGGGGLQFQAGISWLVAQHGRGHGRFNSILDAHSGESDRALGRAHSLEAGEKRVLGRTVTWNMHDVKHDTRRIPWRAENCSFGG